MNVHFQNYPLDGDTGTIRTLAIGGGFSGTTTLIIEITPSEDGEDADFEITLGNGPENEAAREGAAEIAEAIADMLRSPEFVEAWEKKIAEPVPEESPVEYVDSDEFFGD